MANKKSYIIVGAGMAGARAAETLRARGFEDRIFLIGDEGRLPYERPPLSKECLTGASPVESTTLRAWEDWMDIAVHLVLNDPVTALDTADRSVRLRSGLRIQGDKVLLATGGVPHRLDLAGSDLPGVHYLRTADESEALGDRLRRGRLRVAVIGGGFLAVEVASAATALGNEVTWLCRSRLPLTGTVGGHAAAELATRYTGEHLTVRNGVTVTGFRGGDRVTGVVLTSGEEVPADLVLVAIGQRPSLEYLDREDFDTRHGVVVDERLETRVPGVFAAGDIASFHDPSVGGRTRHGTWLNAQNQGQAAARAMLGDRTPYRGVHWSWSDHFGVNVQVAGRVDETAGIVARPLPGGAASYFYLNGDRVVGAVGIDAQREVRAAMSLIEHGTAVDPAALRDPATDLRRLRRDAARQDVSPA
ncbi:FAD-dependent oxidoreductase [Streptomyces sp. NBC_01476]|uniref:NAD(P)/FAD-dependent oxidoreductase n=1 Tax=Streptomyces sp. NBC_01476 TaxID=2903881 RepID=UPI002E334154|nr:FAD-dependent oxidoreductase [Streptomyces sp. NBC_01476]